jgi:hypothetical protein
MRKAMKKISVSRARKNAIVRVVGLLWLSSFLLLIPSLAIAQSSGIGGTVTDATGGVLPGVTVEARSPAIIEQVRTAITDGSGQYAVAGLESGMYSITYSLPGFGTVIREGIDLNAGFTATVDIQLSVGDIEESVTVSGATPVVDIQNVEQRQVMDREVIDSIPTGKSITGYGLLVPGMVGAESWGTPLAQDSGGMSVQSRQRMAIHGGNHEDQQLEINGLDVGDAFSQGANLGFFPDTNMEEMAFQYSGNAAETETGGVRINMIPKEGANTFGGMFFTTFTGAGLQANNLDTAQIDAGLRDPNKVDEVWSINPNFGGPIIQDKLWFFIAHTSQRANIYPAGSYWAANPTGVPFQADYNDQVLDTSTAREQSFNITWQASSKDKVKLYWTNSSTDQDVYLQGRTLQTFFVAPEASIDSEIDTNTYQATWTRPQTNRILLEAAMSHHPIGWTFFPTERAVNSLPGAIQIGPTMAIRNIGGWLSGATSRWSPKEVDSYRASMSYVTGSHNFKFGMTALRQWTGTTQESESTPPWTRTLIYGSWPILVDFFGSSMEENHSKTFGLYAQDQWTVDRLTLNLGVRWDYVNTGYPDGIRPANNWVPTVFTFPGQTVLTWKDFQPRFGLAYDLLGTGRTALKFSANRYGKRDSTDWGQQVNPAIVNRSQRRSWNDGYTGCVTTGCIVGDSIPQGDPLNPLPNGELLTPNTNPAFGTPEIVRFYDPDWAFGMGNRASNWEYTGGIQHELMSGVSLDVGYFHREWINFEIVDDRALASDAFDEFQVQVPTDSRLPNSGQMITLLDQNPSSIAIKNELTTSANNFGGRSESWDGVDVTIDARLSNVLLQGGMATGRRATDQCAVKAAVPEAPLAVRQGETIPLEMCNNNEAWLTQVKLLGSYTFPYDIQFAATLQNQPGPERMANVNYSAGTIAAALGRPATGGAQTINVISPGTVFGDRFTAFDVRFTKIFSIANGSRFRAMFDIFNVFNANSTAFEEPAFGGSWLNPQVIMPGRLAKVAFQLDF